MLPAYAGMILTLFVDRATGVVLPAYAGMIQSAEGRTTAYQVVLPAYAGMIPAPNKSRSCRRCAPRVCGDDPAHQMTVRILSGCSPRMRG